MKCFILKARHFFLREECGATMIEYSLMVALVALVALGSAQIFGLSVKALFDQAVEAFDSL